MKERLDPLIRFKQLSFIVVTIEMVVVVNSG